MRLVVADTSPVNYLLLIGHINILASLFEKVILPAAVKEELSHPRAPASVRGWTAALPVWIEVRQKTSGALDETARRRLDVGEEEAIALAIELRADLVLMDDEQGVEVAREKGLTVIGTLGILSRAARADLIDLGSAFDKLKRTNFRYRQEVLDRLLDMTR